MKVVQIIGGTPTTGACSEGSGTVPRLDLPLTRREFLQGSGVLTGTLAAGSVLVALAPSRSWAVELKTLSSAEGETLMKMGRVLYPHPKLPDAVYALLAKDLDADAGKSAETLKLLRDLVWPRSTKRPAVASPLARPSSWKLSRRCKVSHFSMPCAVSASRPFTTMTLRS
jgi:hypothetical protein